ncbi:MAG: CHAT domain-containing protein [Flavipsychrobacter sp.]|nr:CHAT domain-containing protein [Flavipsychrobacter sp.]
MSVRFQLFGVFLLLLLIWKGFSQTGRKTEEAVQWFERAEINYNLDEPSTASDSLALTAYEKAIGLLLSNDPRNSIAGDAMIKRGNIFQGQRKLATAKKEYYRALNWFTQYGSDSLLFYQASLHLGSNFYFAYGIDSARYYLEQAAKLALTHDRYPDQDVLYNSLGALYFQSSNYPQAANYFEKARMLLDPAAPEFRETFNGFSNNIAICETAQGNYGEALSIYKPLIKDPYLGNRVLQNIGHLYYERNQPDSALFYFKQVQPASTNASVRMYHEMARIYLDKSQPDQVLQFIAKADSINRLLGESAREKAVSLVLQSRLLMTEGKYPDGLQLLDTAEAGINENSAPLVLFEIQELKGSLYQSIYEQTRQQEALKSGALVMLEAIRLASFIRSNYDNDEAKLFFNRSRDAIYKKAAEQVYNWYVQTKDPDALQAFFRLEEAYKGSILNDQLRLSRERSVAAPVRTPMMEKEFELRQTMAYYSSLLNTLPSGEEKSRIEKEMISTRVALSRLQRELNPVFARMDDSATVYPLTEFQQQLAGRQAVLSFLQTDSALFRFLITGKDLQLDRIPLTNEHRATVQEFVTALHQQQEGLRYQGNAPGYALYQLLLQPLEPALEKIESCTILTDGYLHLVPFEALPVTSNPDQYLLQKMKISYHLSFDQVKLNRIPMLQALEDSSWLSFAPFVEADERVRTTGLAALPFSASETRGREGAVNILKSAATKAKFLELGGSKKIVHIASHASANRTGEGDSWIKFYPGQPDSLLSYTLFLPEIYPLPMDKTELVILSACESANGILASGEGLLSLSRAFLYAGSNGVVASLWKSEDQVTAYLIRKFREAITAGKPVEAALQQAKEQLLADPAIPVQFKQPNYWAHLVYIGNCSPAANRNNLLWWVLGAVAAALVLFLYLRNRARSSAT